MTKLLQNAAAGEPEASDDLLEHVHAELLAIAERMMSHERADHTLTSTALVNEAWLRMMPLDQVDEWECRAKFFYTAATAMRRILVDSARAKARKKRGGDFSRMDIPVNRLEASREEFELVEVLALNEALDRLAEQHPRLAKTVELRHFAGLTVDETALALDVSPRTVKRDWLYARAWLKSELSEQRSDIPENS